MLPGLVEVFNIAWYIHEWLIFRINVGKFAIHGCYGLYCVLLWN